MCFVESERSNKKKIIIMNGRFYFLSPQFNCLGKRTYLNADIGQARVVHTQNDGMERVGQKKEELKACDVT